MTEPVVHFGRELEKRPPGIVALVGGGGKTSLLFALGRYLASGGRKCLCTTTTRLAEPAAGSNPPWAFHSDPSAMEIGDGEALLAVRPRSPGDAPGKVRGYSAEEIDALLLRRAADWIVVEADGSAGRPLKAQADHEPVIPSLAGCVVAVVGLGCLGKPFGPDTVFRIGPAAAITGLASGDAITPESVAAIVSHPDGLFRNAPDNAARILLCNQADLPGAPAGGRALARLLAIAHPGFLQGVYMGAIAKDGLACLRLPAS
jgi:probable selenium-dependent hydroxylase accessory protein YqeC